MLPSTRLIIGFTVFGLFCQGAGAELLFGVAPRHSPDTSRAMYQPLLDYLSNVLEEDIRYHRPDDWLDYQRDVRNGRYALSFEAPHLIAWLMIKRRYQPLVNLDPPLSFQVVVRKDNASIQGLNDLITRRVCVLAPPSLPALQFLNEFTDPILQPRVVAVQDGEMAVLRAFQAGRCEGAVLRSGLLTHNLDESDRAGLKVVHTSQSYPNLALVASPEVSPDQRQRIIEALVYDDGATMASAALRRQLAPQSQQLKVSSGPDYIVHSYFLLQKAIFGW